jgi:hypothetical protein
MPSRSLQPTVAPLSTAPCLMALLPIDDLHGPTYSSSLRPCSLSGRSQPAHPRVDVPALCHCAATVLIQVDIDPTSDVMTFLRLAYCHSSTEHAIAVSGAQSQQSTHISCYIALVHKGSNATKDLGPRPSYYETWVPLGPHRPGSQPSRQVGPADQKTHRPVSGPNRPSWQPT